MKRKTKRFGIQARIVAVGLCLAISLPMLLAGPVQAVSAESEISAPTVQSAPVQDEEPGAGEAQELLAENGAGQSVPPAPAATAGPEDVEDAQGARPEAGGKADTGAGADADALQGEDEAPLPAAEETPKEGDAPAGDPAPRADAAVITGVVSGAVADVALPLGTSLENAQKALPASLRVALQDGSEAELTVSWQCADYDGATAGDYTFTAQYDTAAYALADGVSLPTAKVTLQGWVIFSFDAVSALAVKMGTPADKVGLPKTLRATLEDGATKVDVPVTWAAPANYDPNKMETYTFTATPDTGYTYAGALPTARVKVSLPSVVAEVSAPAGITVPLGTGAQAAAAALPAALAGKTSAESGDSSLWELNVPVKWAAPSNYDASKPGAYTFTATLADGSLYGLDSGVSLPTATVTVGDVTITGFEPVAQVVVGIGAAEADAKAKLPASLTVNVDSGSTVQIPVKEWTTADTWDSSAAGTFTYTPVFDALYDGMLTGITIPNATVKVQQTEIVEIITAIDELYIQKGTEFDILYRETVNQTTETITAFDDNTYEVYFYDYDGDGIKEKVFFDGGRKLDVYLVEGFNKDSSDPVATVTGIPATAEKSMIDLAPIVSGFLPSTVEVKLATGEVVALPVTWQKPADYDTQNQTPGNTITVNGTVDPGYTLAAGVAITATVQVLEDAITTLDADRDKGIQQIQTLIPDKNFAAAVYDALVTAGNTTGTDLADILGKFAGTIDASSKGIKSIEGIQWLKSTDSIDFSGNMISDLAPLSKESLGGSSYGDYTKHFSGGANKNLDLSLLGNPITAWPIEMVGGIILQNGFGSTDVILDDPNEIIIIQRENIVDWPGVSVDVAIPRFSREGTPAEINTTPSSTLIVKDKSNIDCDLDYTRLTNEIFPVTGIKTSGIFTAAVGIKGTGGEFVRWEVSPNGSATEQKNTPKYEFTQQVLVYSVLQAKPSELNESTSSILFTKTKEDGSTPLQGAVYALYRADGSRYDMADYTTDEKGQFKLPANIGFGEFYLLETQAPAGYKLSTDKVEFSIQPGSIAVTGGAGDTITPTHGTGAGAAQSAGENAVFVDAGSPDVTLTHTPPTNAVLEKVTIVLGDGSTQTFEGADPVKEAEGWINGNKASITGTVTVTPTYKYTVNLTAANKKLPAALVVEKTAGMDEWKPGQLLTYTITVKNTGEVDLTDVAVTDPFTAPAGLSGRFRYTDGITVSADGSAVIRRLAAGAAKTLTYEVTAPTDEAEIETTLTNIASATAEHPADKTPVEGKSPEVKVKPAPALTIAKAIEKIVLADGTEITSGVPDLGGTVVYKITVTNTGGLDLTDVSVADALAPDGGSLAVGGSFTGTAEAKSKDGSAYDPHITPAGDSGDPRGIGSLPVGASVTFTYVATVTAVTEPAQAQLNNTATAEAQNPNFPGDPGKKVTDEDSAEVLRQPKIELTKTAGSTAYKPGGLATYTLTVKNAGGIDLKDVKVSDPGPTVNGIRWAGGVFELTDAQIAAGLTLSDDGRTVSIPSLKAAYVNGDGATVAAEEISLNYKVPVPQNAMAGDIAENSATATGVSAADSKTSVESKSDATVKVLPVPGLSLEKLVNNTEEVTVAPGEAVTYSLFTKNTGNVEMTRIKVTDAVNGSLVDSTFAALAGTALTSYNGTVVNVIVGADAGELELDRLAPGDGVTLTYTAKTPAGAANGAVVVNTAAASGSSKDKDGGDEITTAPEDKATVKVYKETAGTPSDEGGSGGTGNETTPAASGSAQTPQTGDENLASWCMVLMLLSLCLILLLQLDIRGFFRPVRRLKHKI